MRSFSFRLLGFVIAFTGATSLWAESVERSVGSARITRVAKLPAADLVVLDAGFEAGLRQGMVCTVKRDGEVVGELLVADLRPSAATALILDISSGRSLQSGDLVAVKTVSFRK